VPWLRAARDSTELGVGVHRYDYTFIHGFMPPIAHPACCLVLPHTTCLIECDAATRHIFLGLTCFG
jgi:hypothetical protein